MKKIVFLSFLVVKNLSAMQLIWYGVKNTEDKQCELYELSPKQTVAEFLQKYTERKPTNHNLDLINYGRREDTASRLEMIGSENGTCLTIMPLKIKPFAEFLPEQDLLKPIAQELGLLHKEYLKINSKESYDKVFYDWFIIIKPKLEEQNLESVIKDIQKVFDSSTYASNWGREDLDLTNHLNFLNSNTAKFNDLELVLLNDVKLLKLTKFSNERDMNLLREVFYRFLMKSYGEENINIANFKQNPAQYQFILKVLNYLQEQSERERNIPLDFFLKEIGPFLEKYVSQDEQDNLSVLLGFIRQTHNAMNEAGSKLNNLYRSYKSCSESSQNFSKYVGVMRTQFSHYHSGSLFNVAELPLPQEVELLLGEKTAQPVSKYSKDKFKQVVIRFRVAHFGLNNNQMLESINSLLARYNNDDTISYFIKQLCRFVHQRTKLPGSLIKRAR